MKKYHAQKGSAHAVVVICLVLALITALGWIFWQNFIHKEPTNKQTDVVVVHKDKEIAKPKNEMTITHSGRTVVLEYPDGWSEKSEAPATDTSVNKSLVSTDGRYKI